MELTRGGGVNPCDQLPSRKAVRRRGFQVRDKKYQQICKISGEKNAGEMEMRKKKNNENSSARGEGSINRFK